jgi:hypothetical protein
VVGGDDGERRAIARHSERVHSGFDKIANRIGRERSLVKTAVVEGFELIFGRTVEKFCEALSWANESSTALVWKKKAEMAFQREQYFKAIALLWESVLIAECERFGSANSSNHEERKKADRQLQNRLEKANKKAYKKEKDDFWHLKNLRNAILHGTKTSDSKVVKATDSFKDFEDIFNEGVNLFNKVLANEI